MNQKTARAELRIAREKGFCGFCFNGGAPGRFVSASHKPDCKIVKHAGRCRLRTVS